MITINSLNYYKNYYQMFNRIQQYQSSTTYPSFTKPISLQKPTITYNQMKSAVMNVSTDAKSLQIHAHGLRLEKMDSPLHDRVATSSNNDVITATAKKNASIKEYTLEVKQLAKAQQNKGSTLSKDDITTMNTGINTFQLTSNGKTKTLSVDISAEDTNESAIKKLAGAINDAKLGITAVATTDIANGTVQLNINSNKTGLNHQFSLVDTNGNAISTSGANQTAQQAENALYTLNKYSVKESDSNTISLDNGKVDVTFKSISTNPETISIGGNNKEIIEKTKKLLSSYNELVDTVDQYGNYLNRTFTKNIGNELYNYRLQQLGIEKKADGKLVLNENQLTKNLQNKNYSFDRTIKNIDEMADQLFKTGNRISGLPLTAMIDQRNLYGGFSSYGAPYSFNYSGIFFDQFY